jgi:putative phosphonate metabolism protein
MSAQARYAIYFVPRPDTDLYRFGSAALGYDCHTGKDVPPPCDTGVSAPEWAAITAEPRTYGFHATLNAPFHLRPERAEADLLHELRRFAAVRRSAATFEPIVAELGTFVAIVPRTECPAIAALAADCVTAFDCFRAPTTAEDRARRLRAALTAREIENLDRWGYPYVFADFRFHMTLSGSLEAPRRGEILTTLRNCFAKVHRNAAIAVDRLALVRQDHRLARFRVLADAPLEHVPDSPTCA